MPDRLPVVVVDDKHDQLSGAVDLLESEDWSVTGFDDIDEAARALVDWTEPFVLVLDHDFDRQDGRTGLDLTELLRSAHPWGLILPICYWSGRIGDTEFLAVQRDRQLISPSSYINKRGDDSLVEVVEQAERTFQQYRATFEQQALRRALLDADQDLLEEEQ